MFEVLVDRRRLLAGTGLAALASTLPAIAWSAPASPPSAVSAPWPNLTTAASSSRRCTGSSSTMRMEPAKWNLLCVP